MAVASEQAKFAVSQLAAPSLGSNFKWTVVGNTIFAMCQWGMLITLSKLRSPAVVGQFALGLAISTPVIIFTNLHLRAIQATDSRDEHSFGEYLALRLCNSLLGFIVICVAALLGHYRTDTTLVIMMVGGVKAIESISDIYFGLMQKHEHLKLIALSLIIKGPLYVLALGVWLYTTGSLLAGLTAVGLVSVLMLVTFDAPNAGRLLRDLDKVPSVKSFQIHFHWRGVCALAKQTLPLGLVAIFVSLNANVPRYFLAYYHGETALGYFAVVAYLPVAGMVVIDALGQASMPRLSRYFAGDRAGYRRLLGRLTAVAAGMGVVGFLSSIFFARPILGLLYQADYAQKSELLVWIMVAGGMIYVCSIIGVGLTAARHLVHQVPVLAAVLSSSIIAGALLIPPYGEFGAAGALLVSGAVWLMIGGGFLVRVALSSQS